MLRDEGRAGEAKALLLNYGAFDTADLAGGRRRSTAATATCWPPTRCAQFWSNYLGSEADAADPLACPARAELSGLPPAWFTIAECDILAEQGEALSRRMAEAGVKARAVTYRGATHSFLEAVSSPRSPRARCRTARTGCARPWPERGPPAGGTTCAASCAAGRAGM